MFFRCDFRDATSRVEISAECGPQFRHAWVVGRQRAEVSRHELTGGLRVGQQQHLQIHVFVRGGDLCALRAQSHQPFHRACFEVTAAESLDAVTALAGDDIDSVEPG